MNDAASGLDAGVEARVPLTELIEKLSDPSAYGDVEGPVRVIQTHVSAVFLAGDRVYKVKKPIQLWGFLDYGSFEMRHHWCEVEVELNRRLAPEVYLGVQPISQLADGRLLVGDESNIVEHAVVMVRLPVGATFEERLESGRLTAGDLAEAARVLADFHRRARLAPEAAGLARPSSFGAVVRQNFLSTKDGVPDLFPARVHEGLARRTADRMRRTREIIRRRLQAGLMVNGHGDVRLEHVVQYGGRVCAIDCVEFSDLVRHIDPLCDMAFLSMDLAVRGHGELARGFERAYLECSGDDVDEARLLLPLYRTYRAHVRAKVDAQTSYAPEINDAFREEKRLGARRFLALAWTYARAGETPPMIVMRGASGTGKSVLATQMAPWLDAEIVRSDLVRKELAGLQPTDRLDELGNEVLYSHDMSARTYREVLARAAACVRSGRAAILDATYLRRSSRDEARAAAAGLGAPFAIVDVQCPPEEVRERLRRRQEADTDASDADLGVYEDQVRTQEPVEDAEREVTVSHHAGESPESCALAVQDRLERSLGMAR